MLLACALTSGACATTPRTTVAAVPPPPPSFQWPLALAFPRPAVPADNPMTEAKVRLGRHLFYDRRLSWTGTFSCATCHQQQRAFSESRTRSVGATGERHRRNAMSLTDVAYIGALTWASDKVQTLEQQALIPMLNEQPIELGVAGHEQEILSRFSGDPMYQEMFAQAFPDRRDRFSLETVAAAIGSFERTLLSFGSPFDRYVFFGESDALSAGAKEGMALFFSDRLQCSKCHAGTNFSSAVTLEGQDRQSTVFHNTGLYNVAGGSAYPEVDTGLLEETSRAEDMGRFRAPTLRNIALTAPYMHDGSIPSLEEVLDHYARGGRRIPSGPYQGDGRANRYKSDLIRGFELSAAERAAVLDFLASLTDRGFIENPALSDPFAPAGAPRRAP